MNKPGFPDDEGRLPDDKRSNEKWAGLVRAMRDADPLDGEQQQPSAGDERENAPMDESGAQEPSERRSRRSRSLPPPPWVEEGRAQLKAERPVARKIMQEPARENHGTVMAVVLLVVAGVWLLAAGWAAIPGLAPAEMPEILLRAAAVLSPALLLVILWGVLRRAAHDPAKSWGDYARSVGEDADRSLAYLEGAETRLHNAYAVLEQRAQDSATLAEGSAASLIEAADRIALRTRDAEGGLRSSGAAANEALSLVRAIEDSAPDVDARLSALLRTLTDAGAEMMRQGDTLDERMRGAALAAGEARMQLAQAHEAAAAQILELREASRTTSDEIGGMVEIASARIDLVLDRARTAMASARDGLETHMAALSALGDRGEASAAAMRAMSDAVEEIAARLATLDDQASDGQARITGHLAALGAQAERVGGALHQSNAGAVQLIERVETLLLALDSNIREIDESLPAALGRFDTRLGETEGRLGLAAALAEGMAGTADAAARHLEQASETLVAQTRAVEASISAGEASLARNTAEIAAMRAALDDSAVLLSRMIESSAPQLVAATDRVRADALAAAERTEEAINTVVARAAQALSEASGAALDAAVNEKVSAQIAQIADIADNAVKSAHRATDHLMREMMAIADTASDLERRMAEARAAEEGRDRDHVAERSSQILATLSDSAIDVTRWFAQDISQKEWTSYLGGDKTLFARRAVKLVGSADIKQVHGLYDNDPAFRDHVNRYVEDFEAMLAEVLEARRGHTLAIALLSSDLGKLYVALAQAIERLRVG